MLKRALLLVGLAASWGLLAAGVGYADIANFFVYSGQPAKGFTDGNCLASVTNQIVGQACGGAATSITPDSTLVTGAVDGSVLTVASGKVHQTSGTGTGTGAFVLQTGPTIHGTLTSDGAFAAKQLSETASALTNNAGTVTVDLSLGTAFTLTVAANITTFTISNAVGSRANSFVVYYLNNGTPFTANFSPVRMSGGSNITFTGTNGKYDIVAYNSPDGGTTWFGTIVGQAY